MSSTRSTTRINGSLVQIHLISAPDIRLPFSLDDASRADSEIETPGVQFNKVLLDTRLNNRVLDLRVCVTSTAMISQAQK